MTRKIFLSAFPAVLAAAFLLAGCAVPDRFPATGTYFLCAAADNCDAGVLVLAPDGSRVFSLRDAQIDMCVSPDGTVLSQSAGAVPEDTLLFIRISKSPDLEQTGVWSISERDWALKPQDGLLAPTENEAGRLLSFSIGNEEYSPDCTPLDENSEESFVFSDGMVLYNREENGYPYIADENGGIWLDANTFYEKNPEFLYELTLWGGISIEQTILDEYMIVECDYIESVEDGATHIATASFLCDREGIIQFQGWDYLNVWFPQNQYQRTDHNMYLRFDCGEERLPHFLRLSGMQEAVFPENCKDIIYQNGDLFLLESPSGEYTIYDAYSRTEGASFSANPAGLQNIFLFGTDSYVIQGLSQEATTVVIDGTLYPLSAGDELAFVTSGEYPIISTGNLGGPISISYILDPDGSLILTIPEDVIYADSSRYLILRNDRFQINTYDSF